MADLRRRKRYETFVAEGLGEWTDLEKTFLSLEAMRLEFAGSFDYDLTALGGAADKAVSELKALFGSQGTIFNKCDQQPSDLSSGKPLSWISTEQQTSDPHLPA